MELEHQSSGSENLWVERASQGDLDAFNQLVLIHQNMAYNHAYALLGDSALAEDATQEGFLKAFQAVRSFRGGSFRSWLLRIVTNTAYDHLRRSGKHPTQPLFPVDEDGEEVDSAAWLADPAPSVQNTVEQNELSHDIHSVLDELGEAYRSVLTLIDLHELDYAEAAHALNIPIGTVKSRLARGRLQMRKKLKLRLGLENSPADTHLCLAA